ncbi:MAG: HAMP domain-containing sensor histidine kinase [Acidimicrobiales bacterium]
MTRRLTVVIALVVLGAVTVSTALVLAAGAARARSTTRDEAVRTARQLVEGRAAATAVARDRIPAFCALGNLSQAFRLESIACVSVGADGALDPTPTGAGTGVGRTVDGTLPAGLPATVAVRPLAAGQVLSGTAGRRVWALAALDRAEVGRGDAAAVIVVRRVENPLAALGLRWLVISAVLTVGAGAVAALWLGRRLSQPLRLATAATHELAAGQLHVRLPVDEAAPPGDELADLSRSINALGESLQRSRGLEQRFLLSVSHDLRTPLTSIRGYADALADGTLDDVARGAAVIGQQADRLDRLVRDLLDLAKLDARSFRFDLQRTDLTAVAAALAEALLPDAAERGLHLALTPGCPAVVVLADADRLAQVVANLVENALKYATGAVRLDCGIDPVDGRFGLLTVSDDGPGIAAEDVPHVFERLYVSARVPVRKEAGSGLGLAIVKELVEAMGGQVAVAPAVPVGTTFAVRLPLAGGGTDGFNPPAAPPPTR